MRPETPQLVEPNAPYTQWRLRPEQQLASRVPGMPNFAAPGLSTFLSTTQAYGNVIHGADLRKVLVGQPVLGVVALTYLRDNQVLIPGQWSAFSYVFFWGSIFDDGRDGAVAGMSCDQHGIWGWTYRRLNEAWGYRDAAAIWLGDVS